MPAKTPAPVPAAPAEGERSAEILAELRGLRADVQRVAEKLDSFANSAEQFAGTAASLVKIAEQYAPALQQYAGLASSPAGRVAAALAGRRRGQ